MDREGVKYGNRAKWLVIKATQEIVVSNRRTINKRNIRFICFYELRHI